MDNSRTASVGLGEREPALRLSCRCAGVLQILQLSVKSGLIGVYHGSLFDNVQKNQSLWLPSQPDPPDTLDASTVLSIIGIALGVLFGIMGVGGVIPIWFAGLALFSCALLTVGTLWRSAWLSRRRTSTRAIIVSLVAVVYIAAATPAMLKLYRSVREVASPPAQPSPPRRTGDATATGDHSIANTGDGNKFTINDNKKRKRKPDQKR